jgi:hypothetical protein
MTARNLPNTRRGSLTVVGLGINGPPQTTPEAVACIRRADRVLYLAIDRTTEVWIRRLNPSASSLRDLYAAAKPRLRTYREMTNRIVGYVRQGEQVCAAFYGHPGVLVNPAHWAIRRLRRHGYTARMFPGVSTEACLYADLGINPGDQGVQSFEATNFLLFRRRLDPTSGLVLWQIGVLGESSTRMEGRCDRSRLQVLKKRLGRYYPASHAVVLYHAASFAGFRARTQRVRLYRLERATITPLTTLYVPPLSPRRPDPRIIRWLDNG